MKWIVSLKYNWVICYKFHLFYSNKNLSSKLFIRERDGTVHSIPIQTSAATIVLSFSQRIEQLLPLTKPKTVFWVIKHLNCCGGLTLAGPRCPLPVLAHLQPLAGSSQRYLEFALSDMGAASGTFSQKSFLQLTCYQNLAT